MKSIPPVSIAHIFHALLFILFLISYHSVSAQTATLDVDQNGSAEAATVGQNILRFTFDVRGPALVAGTLGSGAQQTNPDEIANFLGDTRLTMLDVDCNGRALD